MTFTWSWKPQIGEHVLYEERSGPPEELVSMKRDAKAPDWPITAHDARFLKSLHIRVDDPV